MGSLSITKFCMPAYQSYLCFHKLPKRRELLYTYFNYWKERNNFGNTLQLQHGPILIASSVVCQKRKYTISNALQCRETGLYLALQEQQQMMSRFSSKWKYKFLHMHWNLAFQYSENQFRLKNTGGAEYHGEREIDVAPARTHNTSML